MKKLVCLVGLACCLWLFAGAMAWAASKDATPNYKVFQLGEVVVAGQDGGGNEGATVTRFTAEDIEATHSKTVPEALSYIPGVTVSTGWKNEPDIRIHGFQQYEALILIDGVPYYETNYGKLNLNQLPTNMIARIDVIKGAPSVLYGAGAMGGVINIITKTAAQKATFSASGEVGNNGRYNLSASHGNSVGKFRYWLAASRQEADAWRMSGDFTPRLGSVIKRPGGTTKAVLENGGDRNNSDMAQTSLWGKAGVELAPHSKYYLSTYFIDSSWGFPVSTSEVIIFPNRPAFSRFARMDKYQDWGVDLSGEQKIGDRFRLRGKLFYHSHEDELVSYSDQTFSQSIARSTYQDYLVGGAVFADWDILPSDTLRFALHYRGDSHKERDDSYLPFAESFSHTGSAAVENEWRPVKGLVLVAGVSYDWFKVTKAESVKTDDNGDYAATTDLPRGDTKQAFNPMIAASYTFTDQTRLYGSVARKTRFPTLQQLVSNKSGNPDLDPQTSTNFTLGVARPFGDMFLAEGSIFYYDINDRISRDAPYPDSMYRNWAKVRIYGFEVSGQLTPFKSLKLRLGYTLLKADDQSDDRVTDNVINVPEHKVDLGVTFTVPKLGTRIHLEGVYLAEQWTQLPTPASPDTTSEKVDGYFLANIRVTQPICEHLEAFAFVSNIFDRDYESENGFPAMGRNFWVGLKTDF